MGKNFIERILKSSKISRQAGEKDSAYNRETRKQGVRTSISPGMNHTDTPFHLEAVISEASLLSCFTVLPAGPTDWLSLGCITGLAQWKKRGFNKQRYNLNFLPINRDSEKGLWVLLIYMPNVSRLR